MNPILATDTGDVAKLLPPYPRDLSPIEWVAIAGVAVLLLVVLWTVFRTVPRYMEIAATQREKALSDAAAERREDLDAFVSQLGLERASSESALNKIADTHERAITRLHARLDVVAEGIGKVHRDVVQLACYPGDGWTQKERRKKPPENGTAG